METLAPDRLVVRPNRGYAAGVNAGVAASAGRTILAGNPDITFQQGSVATLLAALDERLGCRGSAVRPCRSSLPPGRPPDAGRAAWTLAREPLEDVLEPPASPRTRPLADGLGRDRAGPGADAVGRVARVPARDVRARWPLGRGVLPLFRGNRLAAPSLPRWPAAGAGTAGARRTPVGSCGGSRLRPEPTLRDARRRFLATHHGWRGRLASRLVGTHMPLRPSPLPADPGALPPGVRWWLLSPTALGVPAAGFSGLATDFLASLNALASTQRRPARYLAFAADPDGRDIAGPWWWEARRG